MGSFQGLPGLLKTDLLSKNWASSFLPNGARIAAKGSCQDLTTKMRCVTGGSPGHYLVQAKPGTERTGGKQAAGLNSSFCFRFHKGQEWPA